MVSVAAGKDEILAKQIEVKATGASDVKIYASGANQKAGGVDVTDNSKDKKINKKARCIFPPPFKPEKESPFGRFDINKNGKLDPEELAAMKAYIEALMGQKNQKPDKVDKPDKIDKSDNQNQDILLVLLLLLIESMLKQKKTDIVKDTEPKKDFLKIA